MLRLFEVYCLFSRGVRCVCREGWVVGMRFLKYLRCNVSVAVVLLFR